VLSSGAGRARGPDGENESALAKADRPDLDGVGAAGQRDQVACADIARQDVILHNQPRYRWRQAMSSGRQIRHVRQANRLQGRRAAASWTALSPAEAMSLSVYNLPEGPGTCLTGRTS